MNMIELYKDLIQTKIDCEDTLSQKQRVFMLLCDGKPIASYKFVDLRPRILRASARVFELRQMGFLISMTQSKGNYYYQLIKEQE